MAEFQFHPCPDNPHFKGYCKPNGVYLTDHDGSDHVIARYPLNLDFMPTPLIRSLIYDFSFISPTMAKLHSFNDRLFLVVNEGRTFLSELGPDLYPVISDLIDNGTTLAPNKSADITCDFVTNTIYLAYLQNLYALEDPYPASIGAFDSMDITNPSPRIVK